LPDIPGFMIFGDLAKFPKIDQSIDLTFSFWPRSTDLND